MKKFIITSDTTCDLPDCFCKEHMIDIHPLFYSFGDNEVFGGDNTIPPKEFYSRMKAGEMPTTMASNPEDSFSLFEKRVLEGYDIIHIAFSSALSSSCQNAKIAANELMEKYPSAKITVIDSLCASMGEGLLVYKAVMYQSTHTYDETVQYIMDTLLHISHQFTVDDLFHLQRGGRVSKATAIIGSIVGIKPLLHVNDLGQLIAIGKIRGRKKSLQALVNKMLESMGSRTNDIIMISHGDSLEDAEYTASLIKEKTGIDNIMINLICPTIGAHSGPGTIALFFEADYR